MATAKTTIIERLVSARRRSLDSEDPDSGEDSPAVTERTVISETPKDSPKTRRTGRIRSRVFIRSEQQEDEEEMEFEITSASMPSGPAKARAERKVKMNRELVSPEQRIVANLSISSESDRSSGAVNKRPKRADSSLTDEQEVVQIVPSGEIRILDEEKLAGLGSLCVTRIEQIRLKSSKLQGKLSGELRRCASNLSEILHTYSERLHETGDLANFKIQNANMVAQLRSLRREEEIRKQKALLQEKEILKLKKEIRDLKIHNNTGRGE